MRLLADRASEVAADFFYAAVDEFDDRATPWRDTHRTLAQATIKGLGLHFGFALEALDGVISINDETKGAMARVFDGYGVGARLEERALFEGMGFHVGSEILADREFVIIDEVLRRTPARASGRALEGTQVEILGARHNAYYWIRIHTGVEAEHFDAALKGVNRALGFYAGKHDKEPGRNRGCSAASRASPGSRRASWPPSAKASRGPRALRCSFFATCASATDRPLPRSTA